MKVPSNKISDITGYYLPLLEKVYSNREAKVLLYKIITFYTGIRFPAVDREKRVSESQMLRIHFAVKDLLRQKPLEYITGTVEFYSMSFRVTPAVLIPRPETEELVDLIWKTAGLKNGDRVIDIGTGSGCIAIVLQRLFQADVTAVDISKDALEIARENAVNNGAEVKFAEMDILADDYHKPESKYDLIVSNPPYVKESEKLLMKPNVLDYEPEKALFVTDEDPLVFYRAIRDFAVKNLKPNGKIYLEINETLGKETLAVFKTTFPESKIVKDINGKDRFLVNG